MLKRKYTTANSYQPPLLEKPKQRLCSFTYTTTRLIYTTRGFRGLNKKNPKWLVGRKCLSITSSLDMPYCMKHLHMVYLLGRYAVFNIKKNKPIVARLLPYSTRAVFKKHMKIICKSSPQLAYYLWRHIHAGNDNTYGYQNRGYGDKTRGYTQPFKGLKTPFNVGVFYRMISDRQVFAKLQYNINKRQNERKSKKD